MGFFALCDINDNQKNQFCSILLDITFWIFVLYGWDTLRNAWLQCFHKYIIVIARSVNDWIVEFFFKFLSIMRIYA